MKVIKGLALLCLLMLTGCQSEEETRQFLLACKYDAPATIEAMLNNGIDVDGQDKTGLSGLMVAAAENRREVVALLLASGAAEFPDAPGRHGADAGGGARQRCGAYRRSSPGGRVGESDHRR